MVAMFLERKVSVDRDMHLYGYAGFSTHGEGSGVKNRGAPHVVTEAYFNLSINVELGCRRSGNPGRPHVGSGLIVFLGLQTCT